MSRGESRGTFLFPDNYFLGRPVFKPQSDQLTTKAAYTYVCMVGRAVCS
jgi:hypothetical protein